MVAQAGTACADAPVVTWVGGSTGSWTDAANWSSAAVPDAATSVRLDVPGLHVASVTGQVCDLVVSAGSSSGQDIALDGSLATVGDATVSGVVTLGSTTDASTVSVAGALTVQPSTALSLAAGTQLQLPGGVSLASGSSIHRADGAAATTPHVAAANLTLAGNASIADVALDLPTGAVVDTAGSVLTLTGAASSWTGPVTLKGAATGVTGAVELGDGESVSLSGPASLAGNVILRMTTGSALAGSAATLQAASAGASFTWNGGVVTGALTLDTPVTTDNQGTRRVAAGALVSIPVARSFVVSGGVLVVDGELANHGALRLLPGTSVATNTPGIARITNDSGDPSAPAVTAVGISDSSAGSGTVTFRNVAFRNGGLLSIASGTRLTLSGDPASPTTSQLLNASKLRDPVTPPTTGTAPTPGVLQVGAGATLHVAGKPLVENRAVLLLDDGNDGTQGRLLADGPTTLSSSSATAGTFRWRSGTITGPLTVEKSTTDVGANNDTSQRLLEPGADPALPALTVAGPGQLARAIVTLKPNAKVVVSSPTATPFTVAGGPSGFARSGPSVEGQSVTITSAGRMERSSTYKTETSNGSTTVPATFTVPLVNRGQLMLSANLNLPAGYTQEVQSGSTATPVTGILAPDGQGSGSVTLTAGQVVNGQGSFTSMNILGGRLAGSGIVQANPLNVGAAQLDPGYVNSSTGASVVGQLQVQGPLVLGDKSEVQLFAAGTTADKHDVLSVSKLTYRDAANKEVVVATGTAALAGRIVGSVGGGYTPAYKAVVPSVMTYDSRTGAFSSYSTPAVANGLGFRPLYDDVVGTAGAADTDGRAVDLQLVDVAAPALGVASIPAFTQRTSQRLTYAGVDNKVGVASYDVRWREATATAAYSGWHYPTAWQKTAGTSVTKAGLVNGHTYCFSVRARDRNDNVSLWSQPLCMAKMLDDRALKAHGSWKRVTAKGFYGSTYSRSTAAGATLTTSGTFTRVAVTALQCPTCGTAYIYAGKTLLKKWNLKSSSTSLVGWVSSARTSTTAAVTVKAMTRGKLVVVDALGLMR